MKFKIKLPIFVECIQISDYLIDCTPLISRILQTLKLKIAKKEIVEIKTWHAYEGVSINKMVFFEYQYDKELVLDLLNGTKEEIYDLITKNLEEWFNRYYPNPCKTFAYSKFEFIQINEIMSDMSFLPIVLNENFRLQGYFMRF